ASSCGELDRLLGFARAIDAQRGDLRRRRVRARFRARIRGVVGVDDDDRTGRRVDGDDVGVAWERRLQLAHRREDAAAHLAQREGAGYGEAHDAEVVADAELPALALIVLAERGLLEEAR